MNPSPVTVVLLIMQDTQSRWRALEQLRAQGFRVFAAESERTASRWLARQSPDVVVADWTLPGVPALLDRLARQRGKAALPHLIGIGLAAVASESQLRDLLVCDELLQDPVPAVVLARRLLELTA